MFIAKAQCWKEAIIVKESTAIKERSDLHWNKGIGALGSRPHLVKSELAKEKSPGDFLVLESNWGWGNIFQIWQVNLAVSSRW